MKKRMFLISAIFLWVIFLPFMLFAQEQITITTYYPSPYGVYHELQSDVIWIPEETATNIPAWSGGPVSNSDVLALYRVEPANDSTELRVLIGDNAGIGGGPTGSHAGDKFVVGAHQYNEVDSWYPRFAVQADGMVGIGTDTPGAPLHIANTVGAGINDPVVDGIRMYGRDGIGNAGIELTTEGGTPYIDFLDDFTPGTDFDMRIILTGDNALNIDGGNLGINAPTPTHRLQVNGSIRMVDGNQAAGRVLTSDNNGVGSWRNITLECQNVNFITESGQDACQDLGTEWQCTSVEASGHAGAHCDEDNTGAADIARCCRCQ